MPLSEDEEIELLQLQKQRSLGAKKAPPESWGHWAGRNTLEALPVVGMVGAGLMGTGAGPGGSIAGGALGYAGGKNIERFGKQYLLGDEGDTVPTGLIDQGKQAAGDLATGAAYEMGGRVIAPIAGKALGALGDAWNAAKGLIKDNPIVPKVIDKAAEYTLPGPVYRTGKGILNVLKGMNGGAVEKEAAESIGGGSGILNRPPSNATEIRGGTATLPDSESFLERGKPLEGLPKNSPGPTQEIRDLAENYISQKGLKVPPQNTYLKADPTRGKAIAEVFESMPHDPNNPQVKKAYDALINETMDQWNLIKKSGVKVEMIKPGMENPYPGGSPDMIKDLRSKHLWVFPTESGFGTGGEGHPLLQETGEVLDGYRMKANDIFRAVHDFFGHAKEGNGFGPHGEESAWASHSRMYGDDARRAMTTETRGQNSWVNFGPKGVENQANPAVTTYAEQKAGLLPDWVMEASGSPTKEVIDPFTKRPIRINSQKGLLGGEKNSGNPFKEAFKRSDAVRKAQEANSEFFREKYK